MQPRDLTLEDIADWLTPRQAVKIFDAVFQKSYHRNKPCWAGSWEEWRRRHPSRPLKTIAPGTHRGARSRESLQRTAKNSIDGHLLDHG